MGKSRRDEKAAEGDYEFKLPEFNEQAFIRKELQSARASFYTLGIGAAAGIAATLLSLTSLAWTWGWLPLVGGLVALRPALVALDFPDEVVTWKALIGSYFMLFFTGLSLWVLGVNVV